MDKIMPLLGILAAAFITPGPNNFIVMAAAARASLSAAIPLAGGVVIGTLILVLLACAGVSRLVIELPILGDLLLLAGTAYLIMLGIKLVRLRRGRVGGIQETAPGTFAGLVLFQVVNPKSWVLAMTLAAGIADSPSMLPLVITLVAATASAALALWAVAGATLTEFLTRGHRQRTFDVTMGIVLIASAVLLLIQGWEN